MTEVAKRTAMGPDDLERLIAMTLDEARRLGVDEAEVAATQDLGLSATARMGVVESLEFTNDRGLGVTVYKNSCKGSASTSDMSPAAIREAVAKACSFASLTAADEYAGLAEKDLMAKDPVDLDLDHPWALDPEQAIAMAIACESAALARDNRISNSEGATVASNRGTSAYGNSHGFVASYSRTGHSISCAVLAEADAEMQRDYHYSASRVPEDLDDAAAVGVKAADKTIARLGSRKLQTRSAPVLFVPELARGFIGHAMSAIAGGAQYRRASFLLDAVGKRIFPTFMNVQERPHIPRGMASRAFDSEGVATYDRDIIAGGELVSYILSSYSARRLGLTTTANAGGAQNLVVPGSDTDLESLTQEMGSGLIVSELIGQGVNAVTGDYSRGAVGHWVENGEIQHPVHEVTIAGNLLELYQRIAAVGNDQDIRSTIRCGSVLVEEMTIAGA